MVWWFLCILRDILEVKIAYFTLYLNILEENGVHVPTFVALTMKTGTGVEYNAKERE